MCWLGSRKQGLTLAVPFPGPCGGAGYPEGSLWAGRLIAQRVPAAWGSHTLVEAARALLWAAVADPGNQR